MYDPRGAPCLEIVTRLTRSVYLITRVKISSGSLSVGQRLCCQSMYLSCFIFTIIALVDGLSD